MIDKSDAIAKAHLVGTVNSLDRSKQYDRDNPRELLRAINEAWTKIRQLQVERDKAIAAERKAHKRNLALAGGISVLTTIITALAWEGVKSLAPHLPAFLSR